MKKIITFVLLVSIILGAIVNADTIKPKYNDIKGSEWYAEAVSRLSMLKIVDGLPDGSFNPQGEVTRAQFVKMLVQAMEYKKIDSLSFEDLKPFNSNKPHWASVYVETALRNGVIVKSEIGDNFYPDVPLTRKDMAMMMFRAFELEPSEGANPFADITAVDGCLTKLYEEYLIRGTVKAGKVLFEPEGLTTRAQAAVIISRMIDYKADPNSFVENAAREERWANGTQTPEDIAAKRAIEIAKAKADPNYIMEPMFRVLNKIEDFEGYGDRAEKTYELFAAYISLDNLEDYKAYSPDVKLKKVCEDKNKDLLNTLTRMTEPFISYDHVYEQRHDSYSIIVGSYNEKAKGYIVYYISRDEEKSVNGKWVNVPNYVKKGETVHIKFYFKRGTNTKEFDVVVKVN